MQNDRMNHKHSKCLRLYPNSVRPKSLMRAGAGSEKTGAKYSSQSSPVSKKMTLYSTVPIRETPTLDVPWKMKNIVTPNSVAEADIAVARLRKGSIVLDPYLGVGCSVYPAGKKSFVVGVELDYGNCISARKNLRWRGDVIRGDATQCHLYFRNGFDADLLTLSPPWGDSYHQSRSSLVKSLRGDNKISGVFELQALCRASGSKKRDVMSLVTPIIQKTNPRHISIFLPIHCCEQQCHKLMSGMLSMMRPSAKGSTLIHKTFDQSFMSFSPPNTPIPDCIGVNLSKTNPFPNNYRNENLITRSLGIGVTLHMGNVPLSCVVIEGIEDAKNALKMAIKEQTTHSIRSGTWKSIIAKSKIRKQQGNSSVEPRSEKNDRKFGIVKNERFKERYRLQISQLPDMEACLHNYRERKSSKKKIRNTNK